MDFYNERHLVEDDHPLNRVREKDLSVLAEQYLADSNPVKALKCFQRVVETKFIPVYAHNSEEACSYVG
jgi:hypothetical protein